MIKLIIVIILLLAIPILGVLNELYWETYTETPEQRKDRLQQSFICVGIITFVLWVIILGIGWLIFA